MPVASLDARAVGHGRRGQLAQGPGQERERVGPAPLRGGHEQGVERLRRDREHVVVILDRERGVFPAQTKIAALEHPAVVVGQHRQEQHVAKPRLRRVPVDVEVRGVAARGPVLEHVPPPRIVRPADGHVVGDDVEHLPEPRAPQRLRQSRVAGGPAELSVHGARIDDVVAVRAALRGLQVWRAVEMADAERREVVGDRRRRGEVEAGVELDPIGCAELSRHVSDDRPAVLPGETEP